jgi:hypothetical protein
MCDGMTTYPRMVRLWQTTMARFGGARIRSGGAIPMCMTKSGSCRGDG